MAPHFALLAAAGLAFIYVVKYFIAVIRQYYRLSHIKGPWATGWSRWFIIKSTAKNALHLEFAKAIKQYGHLVRISPNTLLTNDPELIRRMNAVRSPYKKSEVSLPALTKTKLH
jgi:hypothetical protein